MSEYDPLNLNVQDEAAYGPINLDDGLQAVPYFPPDSPQPAPALPGSITIDASQNASVSNNNFGVYKGKIYQVLRIDLTTAQTFTDPKIINVQGTMLWCVWGSTYIANADGDLLSGTRGSADATLQAGVRFDSPSADEIPFGPGFEVSGFPFSRIYLAFPAQANKVLEIFITNDAPVDRIDAAT